MSDRILMRNYDQRCLRCSAYQCGSTACYASAGIAIEMSVCTSIRPSHFGIVSKRTKLAAWFFFVIWELEDFRLCRYMVHRGNTKGSPWARALSKTAVGKNWRFSTFFVKCSVSPKRCKIGPRSLLIANSKSRTHFRLVPKLTTLVDHELNGSNDKYMFSPPLHFLVLSCRYFLPHLP